MRIAHLSDLHFGDAATLAEVERCTAAAIDAAIARGAELAVISGDATDHAVEAHSPSFIALARQVHRLADHCPVLMLQGTYSHEPPGTLDVFRLIGARWPVHVADRIQQVAWDGQHWICSDGWRFDTCPAAARALLSCVPTVNKAVVAAAVGASQAAQAVGEQLALLLAGLGETNCAAAARGLPTIAVSHGTVSGCLTEHGVPMLGLDHEFSVAMLFSARASAFLLGHIHRHQAWQQGRRRAAYPGSIARLHYGEEGPKGWLLWDVQPGAADFEFVETPARRLLHLSFAGRPDMDQVRRTAAQAAGAYVRVRWEIAEEERASVDRDEIARLFVEAAELKLEGRVVPLQRTRAAGICAAPSLPQKLQRWAQLCGADAEPLIERLAWLQAADPLAVAQSIVDDLGTLVPVPAAGELAPIDEGTRDVDRAAPMEADLFGD